MARAPDEMKKPIIPPGSVIAEFEPKWLVDLINEEGVIKHIPLPARKMWIVILRPYARQRKNSERVSSRMLHLCGYVGVLPSSPLYGMSEGASICRQAIPSCENYAHQIGHLMSYHEITYTGPLAEQKRYHFFGIDFAHSADYIPGRMYNTEDASRYRDMKYVEKVCREMADRMVTIERILRGELSGPCKAFLHSHPLKTIEQVQ